MPKPKVLILRAPGTNCDLETAHAFEMAGADASRLHIQQLIERPLWAEKFQILCIPGGFSYGDDIAAGRIMATELQTSLSDTLAKFIDEDRLVLGICNGFQVLMRLGIFFDAPPGQPAATLTWNNQGRFENRWVHVKVANETCPFLTDIDTMYLPIAHAEGRLVMRDDATADALDESGQLVLRYTIESGDIENERLPFPTNPNGAERNVAGLCDESGRIFGLMPHPERHLFPTHHPFWTRRETQPEYGDGFKLFQNAVAYFN
jgi:phosphoribosylformylglycinamidine synthase subunit PurQ / glutaminase